MDREQVNVTSAEWHVMELLWRGPRTLMELVRELGESVGWAKSTVATVVRRMEEKGLIKGELEGRTKVFSPCLGRDKVAAAETESLLSRVYHGSVGLMVNSLLRERSLSRKEIDELYALLDEAERAEPTRF